MFEKANLKEIPLENRTEQSDQQVGHRNGTEKNEFRNLCERGGRVDRSAGRTKGFPSLKEKSRLRKFRNSGNRFFLELGASKRHRFSTRESRKIFVFNSKVEAKFLGHRNGTKGIGTEPKKTNFAKCDLRIH